MRQTLIITGTLTSRYEIITPFGEKKTRVPELLPWFVKCNYTECEKKFEWHYQLRQVYKINVYFWVWSWVKSTMAYNTLFPGSVPMTLIEQFSYDLENGFGKWSLFVLSANGWNIKTWPLRCPAKENRNMERELFDWPIVLQYNVKAKYQGHTKNALISEVRYPLLRVKRSLQK